MTTNKAESPRQAAHQIDSDTVRGLAAAGYSVCYLFGGKWLVAINPEKRYGFFENQNTGIGGGLWFEPNEGGQKTLVDYDGTYQLPRAVALGLRTAGYEVDDTFVI